MQKKINLSNIYTCILSSDMHPCTECRLLSEEYIEISMNLVVSLSLSMFISTQKSAYVPSVELHYIQGNTKG